MAKATEDKLSALHGVVADVLTAQLQHTEAEMTYDNAGEAVETGNEVHTAAPATVAAAIKFLKDNSITCDVATTENMNNLQEALSKKQKHSRLKDARSAALSLVGNE